MSYVQRHVVTLTTDSGGAATGYTPVVTGMISHIIYVKNNFSNGVDFTITAEATGEAIWSGTDVNASTFVAPRQASHSTAGAAALYAGGGSAVLVPIHVANDRIKIVIAQGGSTTAGTFHVVLA